MSSLFIHETRMVLWPGSGHFASSLFSFGPTYIHLFKLASCSHYVFLSHAFSFRETEGLDRSGAEADLMFRTVLGQALGSYKIFQKTEWGSNLVNNKMILALLGISSGMC